VSLTINKNEFLAIIGPTGAGKTTICRSIAGLIPELYPGKSSGTIQIMGKPVSEYRVEEIAGFIGYVHQDAESQILMTNVEKEIAFPLENLALPRDEIVERVENALKLVHLEQYRNRHPFYLSGGQRQRVVLATALAMNPDILILDEAVSEIDPLGAEEIVNVAKELKDMGKTIVFIEHNMEEIARYADRIIVLSDGQVVADDKTEDVLCNMELLERLDIYPPEITQLFIELKRRGVPGIDRIPINPEEGRDMLNNILRAAQ
jgi:energy-coupling factor transport system ATP-binding protein